LLRAVPAGAAPQTRASVHRSAGSKPTTVNVESHAPDRGSHTN
jgi:hypothetical protein